VDPRRRRAQLAESLTRNGPFGQLGPLLCDGAFLLPDVSGLPESLSSFPETLVSNVPKEGDESTHPEWFGASLVE